MSFNRENVYRDINMNGNKIVNASKETFDSHPSTVGLPLGYEYFNTTDRKVYTYSGDINNPWSSGDEIKVDDSVLKINEDGELTLAKEMKGEFDLSFNSKAEHYENPIEDYKIFKKQETSIGGGIFNSLINLTRSRNKKTYNSSISQNGDNIIITTNIQNFDEAGEPVTYNYISIDESGVKATLKINRGDYDGDIATVPYVNNMLEKIKGNTRDYDFEKFLRFAGSLSTAVYKYDLEMGTSIKDLFSPSVFKNYTNGAMFPCKDVFTKEVLGAIELVDGNANIPYTCIGQSFYVELPS